MTTVLDVLDIHWHSGRWPHRARLRVGPRRYWGRSRESREIQLSPKRASSIRDALRRLQVRRRQQRRVDEVGVVPTVFDSEMSPSTRCKENKP